MGTKVLVVGVDAADGALVTRLMDEGRMPTLAALKNRGVSGQVAALPGLADDASWASFSTGVAPGVHGRFHHEQLAQGTYRAQNVTRDEIAHPPFWKALSDAGLTVGVIDFPKSPLSRVRNGLEVADWMPHGEDSRQTAVHPHDDPDAGRFVWDPTFDCHRVITGRSEMVAHAAAIRERSQARVDALVHVLQRQRWDFFAAAIAETHCAGHHFWHVHDVTHPEHQAPFRRETGDLVAREYEAADAALQRLIAAAGGEATVLVFSLIGMGANFSAQNVLDEVLIRIEGPTRQRADLSRLKLLVPKSLRTWLRRRHGGTVSALTSPHARRRAFVLHHDAVSGAIRLNVSGREPRGTIQPGAEYDAWCARITRELLGLVNADTGGPVVREVVKVAEAYPGPHCDRFADLLAIWNTEDPVTTISSSELGTFHVPGGDRTGNHVGDGWFVAAGERIQESGEVVRCRIEDLAPTIAELAGVPLPNVDGASFGDAFSPNRR